MMLLPESKVLVQCATKHQASEILM
uniref:Uncharacterized protein n=1 Tax=Arundo donax TaxID=35708 RepID=A0A0A9AG70_ARUDO